MQSQLVQQFHRIEQLWFAITKEELVIIYRIHTVRRPRCSSFLRAEGDNGRFEFYNMITSQEN